MRFIENDEGDFIITQVLTRKLRFERDSHSLPDPAMLSASVKS
jgi:hypothetical protein